MARYSEVVFPVKKLVALTADMAKAIENYRYENRVSSEAEAIRRLIEAGLKGADPIPIRGQKPEPSSGGDTEKPAAPKPAGRSRKPAAPKAAPMSKEAQLRALREAGAR